MKKEPSPKPTGKNLPEIGPLAGMTIKELEKKYTYDLFDDFLPFMDKFVTDHELGAFMTNVDRDGTRLNTIKNTWYAGRGIWVYSYPVQQPGQAGPLPGHRRQGGRFHPEDQARRRPVLAGRTDPRRGTDPDRRTVHRRQILPRVPGGFGRPVHRQRPGRVFLGHRKNGVLGHGQGDHRQVRPPRSTSPTTPRTRSRPTSAATRAPCPGRGRWASGCCC